MDFPTHQDRGWQSPFDLASVEPPERDLRTEVKSILRELTRLPRESAWREAPRGSGPVLVVPGLMTGDLSTVLIRRFLRGLGYSPYRWGLGVNMGRVEQYFPKVLARLRRIHDAHQSTVAIVGWSLGGVIARELARRHPELVRSVVTLGTPVVGGARYTAAAEYFQSRLATNLDFLEAEIDRRNRIPIDVPVRAVYSRTDQVVAWQACLEPNPASRVDHVEVSSSHIGIGFNPDVWRAMAEHLAAHG